MMIDAHQHFWRYDQREHAWIDDSMRPLQRDFLPADLEPLIREQGIERTIAVQASQTPAETYWLLQLAGVHPFIGGVIGWVDLQADDVDGKLERVVRNRKLVGIRHGLQSEPDDRFMLRPAFGRGIAALARYQLPYDLLIHPRHLAVASDFVEHFDTQTFVLDHLAKPDIRRGAVAIDGWARDLRRLAEHPHVWCKVSGLVTEANWSSWTAKDLEPYLDVAFDCFGAGRLIAGSDWPVCTLAGSYSRTMSVLHGYLERRTAEERAAVLGGNAQKVWRLT
jgi:L-fuconolactonase